MNVIDLEHGLIGCYGIVGGSISAALGASLALKGTGNVAVAYFGDGATNQAYFHECLNFARVFSLPAVFVCENNLYGEFTPMEQVTAGEIRARVEGLDVAYEAVDGMDVWETRAAALRATERARAGRGPVFLEMMVYRFVGHSRSDPGRYRKPGELERWQERDPLMLGRQRLIDDCGLSADAADAIDIEIEQRDDRGRRARAGGSVSGSVAARHRLQAVAAQVSRAALASPAAVACSVVLDSGR